MVVLISIVFRESELSEEIILRNCLFCMTVFGVGEVIGGVGAGKVI
jgi:hypothetical protein